MNQTIETILEHRSIRQFTDEKIAPQILETILKAACNGSSTGNMQLYSIIVTQDKERMREMAPLHFNQPIATNAPLILTFCADFNRFNKFCLYRDANTNAYNNMQSYHWALIDAIIAAQNACVAAESLGLGLCWLGTITYNADKFIDILKLPQQVIPVACIAFGYPANIPQLTDKLPLEAFVHQEHYHDYNQEDIDRIYKEKEENLNSLKLYAENKMPNLAKIFTEKRYTQKDNEHFTQILMNALKMQGFL